MCVSAGFPDQDDADNEEMGPDKADRQDLHRERTTRKRQRSEFGTPDLERALKRLKLDPSRSKMLPAEILKPSSDHDSFEWQLNPVLPRWIHTDPVLNAYRVWNGTRRGDKSLFLLLRRPKSIGERC